MDGPALYISFLFGLIGMGMFTYGYRMSRAVPMVAGAAMMLATYFVPNAVAMLVVCCALCATPWVVRE